MGKPDGASGARMSLPRVIRRILSYLKPYRLLVCGVFFYIALSIGLDLTGPKLLGSALDTLRQNAGTGAAARLEVYRTVVAFGLAYLLVGLLAQAFNLRKELLRTRLNPSVLCDIRVELDGAIQSLCFRFHDQNRSGELITKTTRDIYRIHSFQAETIFLAAEFVLVAGGAAIMISAARK